MISALYLFPIKRNDHFKIRSQNLPAQKKYDLSDTLKFFSFPRFEQYNL